MTLSCQSCQRVCVCNKYHHVQPRAKCKNAQPTKPIHKAQLNISKPYSNILFLDLNTKTQFKKSKARNVKNIERKTEPILFLKICEEMIKKMEVLCLKMVILAEGGTNKTINSHEMRGKNEKILKIALKITLNAQNTRFS